LLLIFALVIWGVVSAIVITKESSPEVQIPIGIISTVLPGASAEDVEKLVTNKIEERVANLQNLDKVTSVSREGVSIITAQYLSSAPIDESIQKLRDEVEKVRPELPDEATDPVVSDVNFVDQPVLIVAITADLPFAKFAELGETLKSELQSIKGVNRVDVSGVRDREVQVVVRKEDLARYGISLPEVVSAIAASNATLPIGAIVLDNIAYNIKFSGDLDQVDDLGSIAVLNLQSQSGGLPQTIYLRDIATVSDGVERASSYSRVSLDGAPSEQALTLYVYKVRGEDVTTVTKTVRDRLDEFRTTLLEGSSILISFDMGEQVSIDLGRLTRTGLETTALVVLSLLLTIGWRESLVAALSIPLSFLIAFIGLLYSGNTINFVSLFSLILAIGILVDSGIVVTEAIHTRLRLLGDKKKAAYAALQEYGWPLIAGTMTTVATFVPLFFISGIVGKFVASIPFTVIFVLLASIFVALGIVPLIAMSFSKVEKGRLSDLQEEYAERARVWYGQKLRYFLDRRRLQSRFVIGMIVAFFLVLSFPIIGLIKVEFFPSDNVDFVYVDLEMPHGTLLAQTDLATRGVEEILYEDPRIESIVTTIGGSSTFSESPQSDGKFANITIKLKEDRRETSTEMVEILRRKLAPVTTIHTRVFEQAGGPPVGAPILLKFTGSDRDELAAAVASAERKLRGMEGTVDVTTSTKDDGNEFVLTIDRGKLSQLGLNPSMVASTLRTAVSGVTATKLRDGVKDTDVVVSLNLNPNFSDPHDTNVATLDAIRQIPIKTQTGQIVLLGSVIEESLGKSNASIQHEDRKRIATVTSNVTPTANAREILSKFLAEEETLALPASVDMTVGGENEETDQSFAEMGFALVEGLVLMFAILVLAFNSFRFTTYLLVIVPLSLIGVFLGLALTGNNLSFPSLLGVIALAGVIINHAIILMDSIIVRLRAHPDKEFKEVIIEAAVSRLRPIFLTTITTVVGMIPLTYASSLWGPLAFSIMFGLTFAMILTLILIPILVYRWPGNLAKFREQK